MRKTSFKLYGIPRDAPWAYFYTQKTPNTVAEVLDRIGNAPIEPLNHDHPAVRCKTAI